MAEVATAAAGAVEASEVAVAEVAARVAVTPLELAQETATATSHQVIELAAVAPTEGHCSCMCSSV